MSKRSWSDVAPDTEEAWQHLSPGLLDLIHLIDEEVLAAQRATLSPEVAATISEATYSLQNCFRYWEELVRNIENDWGQQESYFVDEYVNNLDSRDNIDQILARLPATAGDTLGPLLRELDQRFYQGTTYDGGIELQPWVARLRQGVQLSERWYRKPRVIPWH
jgi:hypothetical protein